MPRARIVTPDALIEALTLNASRHGEQAIIVAAGTEGLILEPFLDATAFVPLLDLIHKKYFTKGKTVGVTRKSCNPASFSQFDHFEIL